jgi:hypothetical protein
MFDLYISKSIPVKSAWSSFTVHKLVRIVKPGELHSIPFFPYNPRMSLGWQLLKLKLQLPAIQQAAKLIP